MAEIHPDAIQALLNATHGAPFDILGAHPAGEGQTSLRALRPTAQSLTAVNGLNGERVLMNRLRDEGLFEATVSGDWSQYTYEASTYEGGVETFADPYIFPPLFSTDEIYLWGEGRYLYSYERFGAHPRTVNGVEGVHFAVWAPNAYRVSVMGDFNRWDKRVHPMRLHGISGIWEIFIPGVAVGESYKFHIRSRFDDYQAEKSDPYAFYAELRPRTASVVADLSSYEWGDADWMQTRRETDWLKAPMNMYEVHPGSWRRDGDNQWLSYRDMASALVAYVKDMGYTHIELMPVSEHPFDGSWGYQVTGYYAPTSRYGTPDDFKYLIDQCHQNGIGVILDWVAAHFPKDGHALSYFDGTHLYEHADQRQGEHPDWGTYIFNYGRNEVRNFLVSNALFWLKEYHIDGLRVDAVSSMLYLDFGRKNGEWIPNQHGGRENLEAIRFLQEANHVLHEESPGTVTIAEESTSWPMVSRPTYIGGLGFTFKWNMGWMHDTLEYMALDPVYRRFQHNKLTFSLMYAFSENFVLSFSHDEVVHGKGSLINKMAGDWWQKFASLRVLYGYQLTHPGKVLNFMGAEIGQWREWSEARSLDWHLVEQFETHRRLQNWVRDMNRFYREQPALYERDFESSGFQWIEPNDADQSVFSYVRFADDRDDCLIIACNFTPVPRHNYRIGVPQPGIYQEVMNSDSALYGGGNVGNSGQCQTDPKPWHAFDQSMSITVPPLACVIFKRKAE